MLLKEIGLSWNEINYEIPFNTIQKMIVDLPQYESDEDNDDTDLDPYADLEEESLDDLVNRLNSIYD